MEEEQKVKRDHFSGMKHTEETKAKMSMMKKGVPTWNKGKSHSEETKAKISAKLKGRLCRGKKKKYLSTCNSKYNVSKEWMDSFRDFEKFKFLSDAATQHHHVKTTNEYYVKFIEKFYYDHQFNRLYNQWIQTPEDKHLKPSLDHIKPKLNGGTNDLDNLQFLTWFENRCKWILEEDEWKKIKKNFGLYMDIETPPTRAYNKKKKTIDDNSQRLFF